MTWSSVEMGQLNLIQVLLIICNFTLLRWTDFTWFQLAADTSEQTACWWAEGAVEWCMGGRRGHSVASQFDLCDIAFCVGSLLKHNWNILRGIPVFPDCYWTRNIYIFPPHWKNVLILIIMTKHDESGSKYYDPPLRGTETLKQCHDNNRLLRGVPLHEWFPCYSTLNSTSLNPPHKQRDNEDVLEAKIL
jgi:hypothetical protein